MRTTALVAAVVTLLLGASGCLDWDPARLERDGRTDQRVDSDAARDLPGDADSGDSTRDMPTDSDSGDTTRDGSIDGDASVDADATPDATPDADAAPGEGIIEGGSEGGSDTTVDTISPDVTGDGASIDGDLGALRNNGQSCATNAQCYSGWCADGVCCNQPCTGDCESCVASGNVGICLPVPSGGLPPTGKACANVGGCSFDGRCNGAGKCRVAPAGTICQAAICSATAEVTVARICNGLGTCVNATGNTTIDCGLYRCNAGRCRTTCAGPGQCTSGGCAGGQCSGTRRALGATCSQGSECTSNNCVEGVCCESACNGDCQSCAVPGVWGRCIPIPNGSPARNNGCAASGCSQDGSCDGTGSCRKTPSGTRCGLTSCSSGALQVKTCDGAGNCQTQADTCGDFKCQSVLPSCFGRCDQASQCATNNCNSTTRTCQ